MGMIAYSFNKDKNSVKRSFQWLLNLILSESDNVEGEMVAKKLKALKEKKKVALSELSFAKS